MATKPQARRLTYADLERMFPEDDVVIRELIDGELFVTPPPTFRHQKIVLRLGAELYNYSKDHGGEAYISPIGVYLDEPNFVEPDVIFIRADHLDRKDVRYLRGAPDLAVEVSSPSTKKRDRTKKRDLYERFGVPEYWFVDLDADRVEVHRRAGERFDPPAVLGRDATLEPREIPGFSISVEELLGPPEEDGS
ncbi:MAG: Uma2 family endonuclease [Actinomycetota bacterium]